MNAYGIAGEAASAWDGLLMDIEQRIGDNKEALQQFYQSNEALTRTEIEQAGGGLVESRDDGTRVFRVASPFGKGTFDFELGASSEVDIHNEGDIVDILAETGMSRDIWDKLTDDEKKKIVDEHGFRRRGSITLRSADGQIVDGRILAAVEGKLTLAGDAESGDVLTTAALHEQMHGVMRIMRDAAKAGNAEAKALVDALEAKFGASRAAEENIADAFEAYIMRRTEVAPENATLIEKLIDYIRNLFGAAEREARKQEERENTATQFLRDIAQGATLDDAVANDEAQTTLDAAAQEAEQDLAEAASEQQAPQTTENVGDTAVAPTEETGEVQPDAAEETTTPTDGSDALETNEEQVAPTEEADAGETSEVAPAEEATEGGSEEAPAPTEEATAGTDEEAPAPVAPTAEETAAPVANRADEIKALQAKIKRYNDALNGWAARRGENAAMNRRGYEQQMKISEALSRAEKQLDELTGKSFDEAQDEARSEQSATLDGAAANDEAQRSSIRRAKRISMTPQETAKFIAEFRETEARFFKREMEPLPWGALHTGDYGYLYNRFSDGTFDIRKRWRIGSKDDNVYWQARKDFTDAIDATPETSRSDNETLRGDGRGHSRNDTDRLGDGRATMDDARLDGQPVRQGGQVSKNGESHQRLWEDIGRDTFAGRDSIRYSVRSAKGNSKKYARVDWAFAFAARDAMQGIQRPDEEYQKLIDALKVGGDKGISVDNLRAFAGRIENAYRSRTVAAGKRTFNDAIPLSALAAASASSRLDTILSTILSSAWRQGLDRGLFVGESAEKAVMTALTARMRAARGYDAMALDEMLRAPATEFLLQIHETTFSNARDPGKPWKTEFDKIREEVSAEDQELMDIAANIDPEEEGADALTKALAKIKDDRARVAAAEQAHRIAEMRAKVNERFVELLKKQQAAAKRAAERRAKAQEEAEKQAEEATPGEATDEQIANDDPGEIDEGVVRVDAQAIKEMLDSLGSMGIFISSSRSFATFIRAFVETAVAHVSPFHSFSRKAIDTDRHPWG